MRVNDNFAKDAKQQAFAHASFLYTVRDNCIIAKKN